MVSSILHYHEHLSIAIYCNEIQNRDNCFALCCRVGSEYRSCVDAITCTESDGELYQFYLRTLGTAVAFHFFCQNETFPGSCSLAFNIRVWWMFVACCRCPTCCWLRTCFITGSIARSANLPVFSLLRGRFWVFSPRTLHRWGWNFAPEGPLLRAKFHPHRCNGKGVGPQNLNFYSDLTEMWNINAPQGHIPCAIFTKFAEFVPHFRMR